MQSAPCSDHNCHLAFYLSPCPNSRYKRWWKQIRIPTIRDFRKAFKKSSAKNVVKILAGFRVSTLEQAVRLRIVLATFGLFMLYVLHDILQEKAFRTKNFKFGWLMTTIACAAILLELGVFALCAKFFEGASFKARPPPRVLAYFFLLSVVLALSQGSGSASLQYVSFPLKVCFKSCKLIPTMLLGVLITGRRYSTLQYVSAALMCTSLILLVNAPNSNSSTNSIVKPSLPTPPPPSDELRRHPVTVPPLQALESKKLVTGAENFPDSAVSLPKVLSVPSRVKRGGGARPKKQVTSPSDDRNDAAAADKLLYRGIFLLVVAIACDALVPNIQERVLSGMGVRAVDMIMWTNMLSGIATFLYTLKSGELVAAMGLFAVHPMVLRAQVLPLASEGMRRGFRGKNLEQNSRKASHTAPPINNRGLDNTTSASVPSAGGRNLVQKAFHQEAFLSASASAAGEGDASHISIDMNLNTPKLGISDI
eukprot:jgi/Bigna1/81749/fgenesh1_pg.83_\